MLRSTLHEGAVDAASSNESGPHGIGQTLRRTTRLSANVDAYDAYLKGRYLNHRRGGGTQRGHHALSTGARARSGVRAGARGARRGESLARRSLWCFRPLRRSRARDATRRTPWHSTRIWPMRIACSVRSRTGTSGTSTRAERHVRRALALDPRSADALQLFGSPSHGARAATSRRSRTATPPSRPIPSPLGTQWYAVVIAVLPRRLRPGDRRRRACDRAGSGISGRLSLARQVAMHDRRCRGWPGRPADSRQPRISAAVAARRDSPSRTA